MTPDQALARIAKRSEPGKPAEQLAYHKVPRVYLGTGLPAINDLTAEWRATLGLDARLALAQGLWATDVFEARIAAAKLLTQARITPDEAVWDTLSGWVPQFDSWAIADHVSSAGGRRLSADPARLDEVEGWIAAPHIWTRRAALVMTLPWTKITHPKPDEAAQRARILGWAERMVPDRDWFIQKAIAWWLRDLSKHAPDLTRDFLARNGAGMKGFARSEAAKHLAQDPARAALQGLRR